MTRSAPRTPALEPSADRAPRHSVQRLVRRCAHAKNPTFSIHFRSVSKSAPSRISSDWLGQLANAKLPLPFGDTGGNGFMVVVPVGKTSPLVVNQSAFCLDCFSYCSV